MTRLAPASPSRPWSGRGAFAVPLVLSVLAIAGVSLWATSIFRSQAQKDLRTWMARTRGLEVGQMALREAVRSQALQAWIATGGASEIQRWIDGAQDQGGMLHFQAPPVPLPGGFLPARIEAEEGIRIGPVEVRPLYYLYRSRAHQGALRFSLEVVVPGPRQDFSLWISEDYEFRLRKNRDGSLGIRLGTIPLRRVVSS